MADINVERKKSPWPWIIGLVVLGLIIWGLLQMGDDNEVEAALPAVVEPVEAPPMPVVAAAVDEVVITAAPMPPPPTDADNTEVPVAVIAVRPAEFLGQPVVGTAEVVEVVSDRGFWVEQDGMRMFAVVAQTSTMEDAININPGQQVRLAGIVYDNAMASQIAGGLESDTMQIVADQPAFLLVDARNVILIDQ